MFSVRPSCSSEEGHAQRNIHRKPSKINSIGQYRNLPEPVDIVSNRVGRLFFVFREKAEPEYQGCVIKKNAAKYFHISPLISRYRYAS